MLNPSTYMDIRMDKWCVSLSTKAHHIPPNKNQSPVRVPMLKWRSCFNWRFCTLRSIRLNITCILGMDQCQLILWSCRPNRLPRRNFRNDKLSDVYLIFFYLHLFKMIEFGLEIAHVLESGCTTVSIFSKLFTQFQCLCHFNVGIFNFGACSVNPLQRAGD